MNKKIIIISIVSGIALLLIGCLIGITYANKKNEEVKEEIKEKEDNNKEEIKIDRKLNDNENKETIKNDNYNEKDNNFNFSSFIRFKFYKLC